MLATTYESAYVAAEQRDEADEGRLELGRGIVVCCCAFGRHRVRLRKVAPFAAYPRCSADLWRREHVEANPGADTALRLNDANGAAASPVLAWRIWAPSLSHRKAIASSYLVPGFLSKGSARTAAR